MPPFDRVCRNSREIALQLAGEVGQASLARSGDAAGLRASVDQHACEIRDALTRHGRGLTPGALLSYAQGFVEAAVGRGWWPPPLRERLSPESGPWPEPVELSLDWESLRLAAVCRMFLEAQGLAV